MWSGKSGVVVKNWQSEAAYSEAVVALLLDPTRRQAMSAAATDMASRYSIDAMAERFVEGARKALVVARWERAEQPAL